MTFLWTVLLNLVTVGYYSSVWRQAISSIFTTAFTNAAVDIVGKAKSYVNVDLCDRRTQATVNDLFGELYCWIVFLSENHMPPLPSICFETHMLTRSRMLIYSYPISDAHMKRGSRTSKFGPTEQKSTCSGPKPPSFFPYSALLLHWVLAESMVWSQHVHAKLFLRGALKFQPGWETSVTLVAIAYDLTWMRLLSLFGSLWTSQSVSVPPRALNPARLHCKG